MSDFINTADVIGDDEMCDQIIMRTVMEYKENRISKIGASSLRGCTILTTVDTPNLLSIEQGALAACPALEALILRGNIVVKLTATDALTGSGIANGTGYIYVPSALVDSYKTASNWSTYAAQIRAIEDYPEITGG